MKKLVAHALPLDLQTFKLPVSPEAQVIGIFETEDLFLWTIEDDEQAGETEYHALRAEDPVPPGYAFVVAGQRRSGAVILLFTERPKRSKAS
jgi:hypothetical protein